MRAGRVAVRLDAADHDRAVAGISHLPLVVAAALAEAVAGTRDRTGRLAAPRLAAGGWRDMTRSRAATRHGCRDPGHQRARGRDAHLRALRAVLDEWLAALERTGRTGRGRPARPPRRPPGRALGQTP